MKPIRHAAVALLVSTIFSPAAFAAPDAATVQKNIESYLGSEPGVISVAPTGEDLQITFDITPYFNKAKKPGDSLTFTPVVITAHENGDGTWNTKSSSPLSVALVSELLNFDVKLENFSWTGVFDEKLLGFITSHSEISNASIKQIVTSPSGGPKSAIAYSIGKYSSDTKSTTGDAGATDFTLTMQGEGLQGTWGPEGATEPAMGAGRFAIPTFSYQADAKGLRRRPLMELLAWFVAHPSKDAMIKDQAQLKTLVTAALPGFESISGSESFEGLTVQSAFGDFTAKSGKIGFDLAGLTKDGRFGEGIEFTGMTIPPGLAPAWATDLIPTGMALGFNVTGFDADAPARIFIDKMDLAQQEPVAPDVNMALAAAALPNGSFKIALPPTTITAPAYAISMTGDMEMSMMGPKGGKLDIKMKGLDAVMAKMQEAALSDPQAAQAIAGLVAAKGMAKAEADGTSSWAIVYAPDGNVTVNGLNLGGLGVPPPPPQ